MNYETSLNSPGGSVYMGEDIYSDNRRKRRRIIIVAVVALVAAIAALAYFIGGSEGAGGPADGQQSQAQTVSVIAPGQQDVVRAIKATGTLAARRETPVGVVGEGGQVVRVFVDAGDWVKQGQVLASIDRSVQSQQAASLEAQIGVARADLQLAQNELERAQKLVSRGFVSQADVDRRIASRDSAQARLNVAIAQLAETKARNARLDIRAPVAGFVLERNVEPGQTVSLSSGILFRLAKDGEMELQALLGEEDLSVIRDGIPAIVTPVGQAREFTGRVWQVSPTINQQTRQGLARVALPFDRALRPGGFASVEIQAGTVKAPVLPESAVQNDQNGSFVYIVGAENKVERRGVTIGSVTEGGLTITNGLTGTEKVVLFAGGFLNPGETVTPKTYKKKIK